MVRMKEALVGTYPNEMEARLLADRLQEEGIRSVIKPRGAGHALGYGAHSFAPHSLYVLEDDLDRARSVADTAPPEGDAGAGLAH